MLLYVLYKFCKEFNCSCVQHTAPPLLLLPPRLQDATAVHTMPQTLGPEMLQRSPGGCRHSSSSTLWSSGLRLLLATWPANAAAATAGCCCLGTAAPAAAAGHMFDRSNHEQQGTTRTYAGCGEPRSDLLRGQCLGCGLLPRLRHVSTHCLQQLHLLLTRTALRLCLLNACLGSL